MLDREKACKAFVRRVRQSWPQPVDLRGKSVLVACSGGPDSMALLTFLHELQGEMDFKLAVFTLHHGYRETASRDEAIVQAQAKAWGLPCHARRAAVADLAKEQKQGFELAGRELRYAMIRELCATEGYDYCALGHHAGDQAESILAHLLRGAGLRGLQGMAFQSGLYWRPFLGLSKAELVDFVELMDVPYGIDETNVDTQFTRNRLRLEILPKLAEENPRIIQSLGRLGQVAQVEEDYWATHIEDLYKKLCRGEKRIERADGKTAAGDGRSDDGTTQRALAGDGRTDDGSTQRALVECGGSDDVGAAAAPARALPAYESIVLDRAAFAACHKAERQRLWQYACARFLGEERWVLSQVQVNQLEGLVDGAGYKEFSLLQMKLILQYDTIKISRKSAERSVVSKPSMVYRVCDTVDWKALSRGRDFVIPASAVTEPLCIRHRREGDRWPVVARDGRIVGHGKLKKRLMEKRVPREERDELWWLASGTTVWMEAGKGRIISGGRECGPYIVGSFQEDTNG